MKEKVSVIVPIYKVEKYLKRCIESIRSQTYKNLEIILVDDGSPDQCGKWIDEFSRIDKRIIPLHKENGGLSDARNYGMRYATGTYTYFVDSDDWIKSNTIELLLDFCKRYEADIVQSAIYYTYDNYLLYDHRYNSKDGEPELLDRKTLMRELIVNEKVKNFAWGKLYRTDLICDLPFKKGVLFEDVFWAHHVMHRVQRYLIIEDPLYYYLQREDSIVAKYTSKNLDILTGLQERHLFIEDYYSDLIPESYKMLLKTVLNHYNLLFLNKNQDKKGVNRGRIKGFIKENYSELWKSVYYDRQLKTQLFLFFIHPYLNLLYLFSNKMLRKVGIISEPKGLKILEVKGCKRGEHCNESVI